MRVVIDVNVVLSSLLTKGNSLKAFELNFIFNKFDFVAPELLLIELEKHKEEFFKRSRLSEEEFDEVLEFILEQINIIPKSEFSEYVLEAKRILSEHLKDVPHLALALKLDCPVFSGDKIFKKLCPEKVLFPREMLEKF